MAWKVLIRQEKLRHRPCQITIGSMKIAWKTKRPAVIMVGDVVSVASLEKVSISGATSMASSISRRPLTMLADGAWVAARPPAGEVFLIHSC